LAEFSVTQTSEPSARRVADVIAFVREENGEGVELAGDPLISIDKAAHQSY
jgi:ssRNA-specific RNase YbeY (16S rRNA maturation enzyme)